jgi:hypothetical protein
MADNDDAQKRAQADREQANKQRADQQEKQRAAEKAQNEQRAQSQKRTERKSGESDEQYSVRERLADAERRRDEINEHEAEKQKLFDEMTDEALAEEADVMPQGGGHFLGGQSIIDTRNSQPVFSLKAGDPNLEADKLAAAAAGFRPVSPDPTAEAERIAGRNA